MAHLTQVHLERSSKKHKKKTIILIEEKKSMLSFFRKPSSRQVSICSVYQSTKQNLLTAGHSTKCKLGQQLLYPPQLHQIQIALFNKFIPLKLIISQKVARYAVVKFGETQAAYVQVKLTRKKQSLSKEFYFSVISLWL